MDLSIFRFQALTGPHWEASKAPRKRLQIVSQSIANIDVMKNKKMFVRRQS